MQMSYVGGKLKLKGGEPLTAAGGVKKKKKKKNVAADGQLVAASTAAGEDAATEAAKKVDGRVLPPPKEDEDRRTEAQKRHDEKVHMGAGFACMVTGTVRWFMGMQTADDCSQVAQQHTACRAATLSRLPELPWSCMPSTQVGQLEMERLRKQAAKGYRERVKEFNEHLASLTEHHDIQNVAG